jgi:hypothetical protein
VARHRRADVFDRRCRAWRCALCVPSWGRQQAKRQVAALSAGCFTCSW